jgi:hypothetical protein
LKGEKVFCDCSLSKPKEETVTGWLKLGACVRRSNDGVQPHSRICRLGMQVDPIDTILGNTVCIGKVNSSIWSKGVLVGEELERGEVNTGSIGQVLSVDTKRPIEIWTKGVGLAFTNWVKALGVDM